MAVFRDDPEEWQRLDLGLLKNGPVHLYYRPSILDEDVGWLRGRGYVVDDFDCSAWTSLGVMHEDLARRLEFPDYYGRNLNAFNDCLSDLPVPEEGGRVFVFRRYDAFAANLEKVAWDVLDIVAGMSWLHLLFGRRLFALVQSDDPRIEFPPFGCQTAGWNGREWLNRSRGL